MPTTTTAFEQVKCTTGFFLIFQTRLKVHLVCPMWILFLRVKCKNTSSQGGHEPPCGFAASMQHLMWPNVPSASWLFDKSTKL